MRLTLLEAQYVLALIAKEHGSGYAKDPQVGALQAKLSMTLEIGQRAGDDTAPAIAVKPTKVGAS